MGSSSPGEGASLQAVLGDGGGGREGAETRALAAFEAIGPETGISPESRALITDYLLGQLPDRVAEQTRERLAGSPYYAAHRAELLDVLLSGLGEHGCRLGSRVERVDQDQSGVSLKLADGSSTH